MNFETVNLTIQVRPNDLDSSGHVNNATVVEYLDAGRWSWLKHHNLARGQRIIPVVARLEINYRHEILLGEVKVITKVEEAEKPRYYQVVFQQSVEIFKDGAATIASEARVKVGFIDSKERTIRTLQDFIDDIKTGSELISLTSLHSQ
ncbi:thioesterase family protein [Moorena producens JHB]|uniref:Thioesterase family protein n=1 Tax=Moorena producens (strain JHB) TaxID=1454205 RepID=A0A1D9GBB8_MOOP1|nr:thioesterase family protein [Moorena producens]AOY84851.1 thioesterase family protein [Moorena producens JHB]